MLVQCEDLPEAQDGSLASLVQNHVGVTRAYALCAGRHADLVDLLRTRQQAAP